VSVHNVEVKYVGATTFNSLDLLTKSREVGGQDGRRDFDVAIARHSNFDSGSEQSAPASASRDADSHSHLLTAVSKADYR
jgi:hypothetical protein